MAAPDSVYVRQGFCPFAPLTVIHHKPVLQWTLENLDVRGRVIFVVQRTHYERYNLPYLFGTFAARYHAVVIDEETEGSAASCLRAREYIDNDQPIIVANPDQVLQWNPSEMFYRMGQSSADGIVVTVRTEASRWRYGYVQADPAGNVRMIAAKRRISDLATTGIHYWRRGSLFVRHAEQMIAKDIRTNDRFYVCSTYNQAIADHRSVRSFEVPAMWDLGTPDGIVEFKAKVADAAPVRDAA